MRLPPPLVYGLPLRDCLFAPRDGLPSHEGGLPTPVSSCPTRWLLPKRWFGPNAHASGLPPRRWLCPKPGAFAPRGVCPARWSCGGLGQTTAWGKPPRGANHRVGQATAWGKVIALGQKPPFGRKPPCGSKTTELWWQTTTVGQTNRLGPKPCRCWANTSRGAKPLFGQIQAALAKPPLPQYHRIGANNHAAWGKPPRVKPSRVMSGKPPVWGKPKPALRGQTTSMGNTTAWGNHAVGAKNHRWGKHTCVGQDPRVRAKAIPRGAKLTVMAGTQTTRVRANHPWAKPPPVGTKHPLCANHRVGPNQPRRGQTPSGRFKTQKTTCNHRIGVNTAWAGNNHRLRAQTTAVVQNHLTSRANTTAWGKPRVCGNHRVGKPRVLRANHALAGKPPFGCNLYTRLSVANQPALGPKPTQRRVVSRQVHSPASTPYGQKETSQPLTLLPSERPVFTVYPGAVSNSTHFLSLTTKVTHKIYLDDSECDRAIGLSIIGSEDAVTLEGTSVHSNATEDEASQRHAPRAPTTGKPSRQPLTVYPSTTFRYRGASCHLSTHSLTHPGHPPGTQPFAQLALKALDREHRWGCSTLTTQPPRYPKHCSASASTRVVYLHMPVCTLTK
ncbi:hypothetical protein C7M84_017015 [Penaeus vannamei]|uniref:Uncharacterized protein n=1 Tax=Penaeus vannamei TaxID=6689 RepID=A0A423SLH1_PENVA|nr:hypothetical protein C7M84_017015 [Penaeus vannamei]